MTVYFSHGFVLALHVLVAQIITLMIVGVAILMLHINILINMVNFILEEEMMISNNLLFCMRKYKF